MPRRRSRQEDPKEFAFRMVLAGVFMIWLFAWATGKGPALRQLVGSLITIGLVVGVAALAAYLLWSFTRKRERPSEDSIILPCRTTAPQQQAPRDATTPTPSPPAPVLEPSMAEQVRALDWFQFEKLVQLWFARQGYRVEKRGGANPDGGVDFVAFKDGQVTLVQCKHWRKWQVKPNHVRELLGAMTKEKASRCVLVATGGFTEFARQEAKAGGVELIDGGAVVRWLEEERYSPRWDQVRKALDPENKWCPRCESPLVRRLARKGTWNGREFWGCSTFPRCDFKMPIDGE